MASELGEMLEVHAPEAGMHLVGWLPPHMDDANLKLVLFAADFLRGYI